MSSVIKVAGIALPIAERILDRWLEQRSEASGKPRSQIIAEAEAEWGAAERNAEDLKNQGHSGSHDDLVGEVASEMSDN